MKSTVPDRVALMMKELDLDQVGFARVAGTTKSVVNQWLSGKIKSIAAQYAYNIQRKKKYSAEWIQTGSGDQTAGDFTLDADTLTLIKALPLISSDLRQSWLDDANRTLERHPTKELQTDLRQGKKEISSDNQRRATATTERTMRASDLFSRLPTSNQVEMLNELTAQTIKVKLMANAAGKNGSAQSSGDQGDQGRRK